MSEFDQNAARRPTFARALAHCVLTCLLVSLPLGWRIPPPARGLQAPRSGRQYAAADGRPWSNGNSLDGRDTSGGDGHSEKQEFLVE